MTERIVSLRLFNLSLLLWLARNWSICLIPRQFFIEYHVWFRTSCGYLFFKYVYQSNNWEKALVNYSTLIFILTSSLKTILFVTTHPAQSDQGGPPPKKTARPAASLPFLPTTAVRHHLNSARLVLPPPFNSNKGGGGISPCVDSRSALGCPLVNKN